ncbi:MAG: response regulator transcription factor [Flavobacteriales bacterium]|nr:response regulator transcription factor [Flavobacteriales bacterium]
MIKVAIADDHKIFRQGVIALLQAQDNMVCVGEASDGKEIQEIIANNDVDVVLMDIDMPNVNGIEASKKIHEFNPECKILVLSMHADTKYIITMLDAGATGYILKNADKDEMIEAINAVAKGNTYYSQQVSSAILQQLHARKKAKPIASGDDIPLTQREIDVLKLIVQEYSNAEIAEELFISIRTVDTHKRNLLEKLELKNTAGLVKYAIKKGLTDI